MNPLTNVKNIQKLNAKELQLGIIGKKSWHDQYKDSAWVFVGGLPYDLTEGDIICVFSQYGEIVNINLVRDKKTGNSKGYCFICFEDQRSTVLSVDNLNSIKLLGRIIRVDHVENYRQPKAYGDEDEVTKILRREGCAPVILGPEDDGNVNLEAEVTPTKKIKKEKHEKKTKKKKKAKKKKLKRKKESSQTSDSAESNDPRQLHGDSEKQLRIKQERVNPEYEKYSWEKSPISDASIKSERKRKCTVEKDMEDIRKRNKESVSRRDEKIREKEYCTEIHDRFQWGDAGERKLFREKYRDSPGNQCRDRHKNVRERDGRRDDSPGWDRRYDRRETRDRRYIYKRDGEWGRNRRIN